MPDLTITIDSVTLEANWTDTNETTQSAIKDALPIEGDAARWGDELYFRTTIDVPEESSQIEVPVGSIAYWPQGNAVCIFWGPTPASTDSTPRAASPVNVVATITDTTPLESIEGSATIRIE